MAQDRLQTGSCRGDTATTISCANQRTSRGRFTRWSIRAPAKVAAALAATAVLFLGSRTAPAVHSAGTSALDTGLDFPARVLAGANGSLYISDTFAHLVRRLDQDGTLTTVAGTGTGGYGGDGGPAQAAQLDFPMGLALDAAGNLYLSLIHI